MMMAGDRYGDAQRRVQSLGPEQTLVVQQTLVFYTVTWRIWAALNLHNNFVCLPRLENIVYRWVIAVPFQTVSNIHWLCTCIDRGSEPCFAG